jgi:U4/U6.U5 tri-snRNP-associated protein 1
MELKKKKPVYNAYDDDEHGERSILAQYDEEIDGKKKKRFVLDGSGNSADINAHREEVIEKLKAKPIKITLDLPSQYPQSCYCDSRGYWCTTDRKSTIAEPEVVSDYAMNTSIRKSKKKKSKSTRKKSEDDDSLAPPPENTQEVPDNNSMEVDLAPASAPKPKRTYKETSFVDDEDLQDSLATQRRAALKKRKILKPDAFARKLLEDAAAVAEEVLDEAENAMVDDEEGPGLIIDETTEFVANLRAAVIPERKNIKVEASRITSMADDWVEPLDGDIEDMEVDSVDEVDGKVGHKSNNTAPGPPDGAPEFSSTGLEEEMTMSRGVGATLAMLNQRGLLKRDEEAENKVQLLRDRQNFNVQKRLREVEAEEKAKSQRLRDRQSGKFDRMSAREREEHARWENKQRDLQEARDLQTRFKEYRPDVNLQYKDEFGRDMTPKEVCYFQFPFIFWCTLVANKFPRIQ